MKTIIDRAERLWRMPQPALGPMRFTEKRLAARGVDYIDLGKVVFEPPQHKPFLDELGKLESIAGRKVAGGESISRLKRAIAEKHLSLRSVKLNPETEIALIPGVRMAVAFVALSLMNPEDVAAYPDPGPQHLRTAICLAGGVPISYCLTERNDYILNIPSITEPPPKRLKIVLVSYPHDPTGAEVDHYFYRDLLRPIKYDNILIIADCAYIHPGDPEAVGPLQVKGARKKALELHSFGASLGIDGLGFAVGHRDAISILASLLDALGFEPDPLRIEGATVGLDLAAEIFKTRRESLQKRRGILEESLRRAGWRVKSGKSTPFAWVKSPTKTTSLSLARRLFVKAGVRTAPGSDFGEEGEGWLRISLTCSEEALGEATRRISRHSLIWHGKYKPGR